MKGKKTQISEQEDLKQENLSEQKTEKQPVAKTTKAVAKKPVTVAQKSTGAVKKPKKETATGKAPATEKATAKARVKEPVTGKATVTATAKTPKKAATPKTVTPKKAATPKTVAFAKTSTSKTGTDSKAAATKKQKTDNVTAQAGLSNDQVDVARRVLDLSETIREAVNHLLFKLGDNDENAVAAMLRTVGEGLTSLDKAMLMLETKIVIPEKDALSVREKMSDVFEMMDTMISLYLDERTGELQKLGRPFENLYTNYDEHLNHCLKSVTVV